MNEQDQIKNSLDKITENLDQDTLSQLDQLRRQVLDDSKQIKWYEKLYWPMLGPAIAAIVLVVMFNISNLNQSIQHNPIFDDLELLANNADTELIEDLEFIAWLEEENVLEGELL